MPRTVSRMGSVFPHPEAVDGVRLLRFRNIGLAFDPALEADGDRGVVGVGGLTGCPLRGGHAVSHTSQGVAPLPWAPHTEAAL